MPWISQSDLEKHQKQLTTSRRKLYDQYASGKNVYAGSEEEAASNQPAPKAPSLLDRAAGAGRVAREFAGDVAQSATRKYTDFSKGLAEVVADVTGESDRQTSVFDDEIENASHGLRVATEKMRAAQDPKEKKRWQQVMELNQNRIREATGEATSRTKEIQERTDPLKGAANLAGIGIDVIDVLSGGTLGAASKGASIASQAARGAATGGALEAAGSVPRQYAEDKNVDLRTVLSDLAFGAGLGAAGGAGAGYLARRRAATDLVDLPTPAQATNPTRSVDTPAYMRRQAGAEAPELGQTAETPNIPSQGQGAPGAAPEQPQTLAAAVESIPEPAIEAPVTGQRGATPRKQQVVEQAKAEIQKNPNRLQRAFTSARGDLSRMGATGKDIANRLQLWRDNSEMAQQGFMEKIPSVLSLNKREFPQFVEALDALSAGTAPSQLPRRIADAVEEWRQSIPAVRQAAENAGIEVGDLGEYYFPRNYDEYLRNKKNFDTAAKHLVDTGQADKIGEAIGTLRAMKRRYSTPYGHFENSRTVDLPDFDKSKNAVIGYVRGAFDKVSNAEQFGPNGENIMGSIQRLKAEGHDGERALKNYMISTGIYNYDRPTMEGFSAGIRSFNRLRALGLSAILNLGQSTNTATFTGTFRTLLSAGKLLSKQEREYVRSTGVVLDSVLQGLREQTGVAGKATNWLTAPGFNKVEQFNRLVAGESVKSYAQSLAKKAARGNGRAEKILREKLGVEGEIGRTLTDDQLKRAMRRGVERTQFRVDPQDLPGWVDSPEGKLVAQFRTFVYKQSGFMLNEVLKEAGRGNLLPAMRFMAVGGIVGYGTGQAREALRGGKSTGVEGTEDKQSATDEFLEAMRNVGAFGFGGDVQFLGSKLGTERFPQYVAGTLGGPTAGLAAESAINVGKAGGGDLKPLGRQALGDVPVVGSYASANAFPYQPKVTEPQKEFVDAVDADKKQNYYDFFNGMKNEGAEKRQIGKQVRDAVENRQYTRARRIADEHNKKVAAKVGALEHETGDIPDEMVKYIQSNYMVSYDYYENRKK